MGMMERWMRNQIMAAARDTIREADPPLNLEESGLILNAAYDQVAEVSLMDNAKKGAPWFKSFGGMCQLIWLSGRKGVVNGTTRDEFIEGIPHDMDKLADMVLMVIDISDLFPKDEKPEKKKKKTKKKQ